MEKQRKTTLKCGGCVAKIQAEMDARIGAHTWTVVLESPEKWIQFPEESEAHVEDVLQKNGFGFKD